MRAIKRKRSFTGSAVRLGGLLLGLVSAAGCASEGLEADLPDGGTEFGHAEQELDPATGGLTWESLNPGAGGQIQDIALDPDFNHRAFVLSDVEGLYRTTNGGRRWDYVGRGLAGTNTLAMAFERRGNAGGRRIYLGTTIGLHRSTDGGRTWRLIEDVSREGNPGFSSFEHPWRGPLLAIGAIVVDPEDRRRVIAAVGDKRDSDVSRATVFRSVDRGETFQRISFGPSGADRSILQLAYSPQTDQVYAACNDGGLWQSADFGETWSAVLGPERSVVGVAVSPDGSRLYAAYRGEAADRATRVYGTSSSRVRWWALDHDGANAIPGDYRYLVVDPRRAGRNVDRFLLAQERGRQGLFQVSVRWQGDRPSATWERVFHYDTRASANMEIGWEGGIYGNRPRPLAYAYSPLAWTREELWTTGDQTLFRASGSADGTWHDWRQVYTGRTGESFSNVGVRVSDGPSVTRVASLDTYASTGWESTVDFDVDQRGDVVVSAKADHGVVMSWNGGASWEDVSPPRMARSNEVEIAPLGDGAALVLAHLSPGFGADARQGQLWAYRVSDVSAPRPGAWHFLAGGGNAERAIGLPNVSYNAIVSHPDHPRRVFIATASEGIYVVPDIQYLYRARAEGLPLPWIAHLEGSPSTPDDKNNPLWFDPRDPRLLYVTAGRTLWRGRWSPRSPGDTSDARLGRDWSWEPILESEQYIATSVWADAGRTWIAATVRDEIGQHVDVSSDSGRTWTTAISRDALMALREPTFDFCGQAPDIYSVAGDGSQLFVVLQRNAPENLGYGVFEVRRDGDAWRSARDVTGNLPFPKAFNLTIVNDPASRARWLFMSSWGAGTWRARL